MDNKNELNVITGIRLSIFYPGNWSVGKLVNLNRLVRVELFRIGVGFSIYLAIRRTILFT